MSRRYAPERIEQRIRTVWLERAYRLIHRRHREDPLGTGSGRSRFGDPHRSYGVLYAAETLRCAIWEGALRDRFARRRQRILRRHQAEKSVVVTVRTIEPLALVDLRDDGPVRIGAPTAVAHDADHRAGQALSAATYRDVPTADGFVYQSRFTADSCVAVFDRATAKLAVRDAEALAQHPKFAEVLSDYEIALDASAK